MQIKSTKSWISRDRLIGIICLLKLIQLCYQDELRSLILLLKSQRLLIRMESINLSNRTNLESSSSKTASFSKASLSTPITQKKLNPYSAISLTAISHMTSNRNFLTEFPLNQLTSQMKPTTKTTFKRRKFGVLRITISPKPQCLKRSFSISFPRT